jgi:ribulose 1,5-bisphosphate carboxylase large subunit-like protein
MKRRMENDLLVQRAVAGDPIARDALLVAEQPLIRSFAKRYAPWCLDDAANEATLQALVGFDTLRVDVGAQPFATWRRWVRTVTRNAAWRLARRLGRGSSQSNGGGDSALHGHPDTSGRDAGSEYDDLRQAAIEAMPLGARLGWIARERHESAKSLARKLGLGVRGANYHVQVGSQIARLIAEVRS